MSYFGFGTQTTADLSDKELDAAYDALRGQMADKVRTRTWSAQDDFKLNEYASEIVDRLTSLGGVLGAFTSSADRFPSYTKWSKFSAPVAATQSAKEAVAKLPDTVAGGIASATTGTLSFAFKAFWPLLVVAAVGGVIYIKAKKYL